MISLPFLVDGAKATTTFSVELRDFLFLCVFRKTLTVRCLATLPRITAQKVQVGSGGEAGEGMRLKKRGASNVDSQ